MASAVCLDGEMIDPAAASVPVFDRGFLYGEGAFEVLRVYGGNARELEAHVDRLVGSMRELGIAMPVSKGALSREVTATVRASGLREGYVRVMVTAGDGVPGLHGEGERRPRRVILVLPLEAPPAVRYEEGVPVVLSPHPTHPAFSSTKRTSYADHLRATAAARRAGAHEVILLGEGGQVREGASSNVFVVTDGALRTPPKAVGLLPGITRRRVIELAAAAGVRVCEEVLFPADLYRADEVFLTSTIREVLPVTRVDGQVVGAGRPGPLTRRLLAAYRDDTSASVR